MPCLNLIFPFILFDIIVLFSRTSEPLPNDNTVSFTPVSGILSDNISSREYSRLAQSKSILYFPKSKIIPLNNTFLKGFPLTCSMLTLEPVISENDNSILDLNACLYLSWLLYMRKSEYINIIKNKNPAVAYSRLRDSICL